MPAWLPHLTLTFFKALAGDEGLKKLVALMMFFVLLLLIILITLPVLVVHIPLVTAENIEGFFQGTEQASRVTKTDDDKNGITIPWEEVLAVWTVLHKQDFSNVDAATVQEFALNWVERHEKAVEQTGGSPGNNKTKTKVWYILRDCDEVMNRLGYTKKQKEQANMYLQSLSAGGLKPPAGWRAKSLPGWAWPVPDYDNASVISSGFGMRVHPITHVPGFHQGIDIAAPEGMVVAAAIAGTVQQTGTDDYLGQYVKIKGGGFETSYGHMSSILVSTEDRVKPGQTIGYVGNTGVSTGPHLHFEIRFTGQYQNPLRYY